jgi:subtilisin-like proprotein convertase family protein
LTNFENRQSLIGGAMKVRGFQVKNKRISAFLTVLLSVFLTANLFITTVSAVVFTNSTPINTNLAPTAAVASPYPATISVSGLTGTVTNVSVTLNNVNHTFPDDIDVLLVGPGGQSLILMSDAGGTNDLVNTNLTFEDAAAAQLSDSGAIPTGSYKPTNHGGTVVDEFPPPAPAAASQGNPGPSNGGTATFASVFNTTNPNGTWSLYVVDDLGGDEGFIAGGWSIRITTTGSAATTFSNANRIRINDLRATSTPYPSTITVSGVSGAVTSISVTLNNITHPNPDDLDILLVGPGGQSFILMSDAGGTTDIAGVTLTINDAAAQPLPDSTVLTTGSYRPANYDATDTFPSPAPEAPYGQPAPAGTATLASVFGGTNPNGVWSLYVVDDVSSAASQGTIAGGWSIDINGGGTTTPDDAVVDFNGDGRTDYAVVRNGAANAPATWFIAENGATPGTVGAIRPAVQFGRSPVTPFFSTTNDILVPADYDGDDRDDIAVWRPTGLGDPNFAYFFILRSSSNTLESIQFGRQGDNPRVIDDYDGDDRDDVAVYRTGAASGAVPNPACGTDTNASAWYYRPSGTAGVNFRYVCWGRTGDTVSPGDYDGDGRADYVVRRAAGVTTEQATFFINRSSGGIEVVGFGSGADSIVPGDYDGDARTDIATFRGIGGVWNWFIRQSSNGQMRVEPFGAVATDTPVQGDYNGDGRTDVAVFRPNADGTQSAFFVSTSPGTGGATSQFAVRWGQQGDVPAAAYNLH